MLPLDARLIAALRAASVHLPAGDFAAQLGSDASTILGRVQELRAAGFEIDERPGLGLRLVASPDRLIADDIRARLGESSLIREVIVFAETDSTNERAAQLGRGGAAGGVAIFAERQTAGRGRFGRRWESASHLGLWFSLLLRPSLAPELWPRLTTCAAVAVAAGVEAAAGIRAQVKWPNDIQHAGRKLAGILIETGTDSSQRSFAVIGIGLNVNHEPDDFSPELADRASSLRAITGRAIDRAAVAVEIFREFEKRLPQLADGFNAMLDEARTRSALLGKWVRFHGADAVLEGIAEALDADGSLLLRGSDGLLKKLTAGEVTTAGPS